MHKICIFRTHKIRTRYLYFNVEIYVRFLKASAARPMTMETRCRQKKAWISKIPAIKFMYRSLWANVFFFKRSKRFFFYREKKSWADVGPNSAWSWADVGPNSAWEKLSQMLIRSGKIPSPRQPSIDKTNDCAMRSERGALVRGSNPTFSGHSSVHKMAGNTCRTPATRLIQTKLNI